MRTALMIILGVISILLVVVIMLQSNNGEGLSSTFTGGSAEQLFGNKKSKGYEKMLSKLTIAFGTIFVALTVVLLIIK